MAPPKMPWFRFYVETIDDPKILLLTPAERWVWPCVMSIARSSRTERSGRLELVPGVPVDLAAIAAHGHVPVKLVKSAVEKMLRLGLLEHDGVFLFAPAFSRRQFESDLSSPRVAKGRDVTPDAASIGRYINGDGTSPEDRRQTTELLGTSHDDDQSVPAGLSLSSDSISDVAHSLALDVLAERPDITEDRATKFVNGTRRNILQERRVEIIDALKAANGNARAAYQALSGRTTPRGPQRVAPIGDRPPHAHELAGCVRCEPTWGKYDTGNGWADCTEPVGVLAAVTPIRDDVAL